MAGFIIDTEGPKLTGAVVSEAWDAVQTRNFYSMSIIWGVLGPKVLFGKGSDYSWIYYGFLIGPVLVAFAYALHRWKPKWHIEERFNPVVLLYGGQLFPIYQM